MYAKGTFLVDCSYTIILLVYFIQPNSLKIPQPLDQLLQNVIKYRNTASYSGIKYILAY